MHNPKVLIVDDEEMSLFLLEMILVDEGFSRIDKAQDGGEALELYEDANFEDCYDAVFLDIQLPDMSGLEVLRRIRDFDEESDCRTAGLLYW
jgi:CheY-like chemotaxis protein